MEPYTDNFPDSYDRRRFLPVETGEQTFLSDSGIECVRNLIDSALASELLNMQDDIRWKNKMIQLLTDHKQILNKKCSVSTIIPALEAILFVAFFPPIKGRPGYNMFGIRFLNMLRSNDKLRKLIWHDLLGRSHTEDLNYVTIDMHLPWNTGLLNAIRNPIILQFSTLAGDVRTPDNDSDYKFTVPSNAKRTFESNKKVLDKVKVHNDNGILIFVDNFSFIDLQEISKDLRTQARNNKLLLYTYTKGNFTIAYDNFEEFSTLYSTPFRILYLQSCLNPWKYYPISLWPKMGWKTVDVGQEMTVGTFYKHFGHPVISIIYPE